MPEIEAHPPSTPSLATELAIPGIPPSEPPGTSLTGRTMHGFAWTILNAVGSKVASLAGQVVLAWVLLERDFGFIGLAYTVSTFAGILQQGGVKDVLIQRSGRFAQEASPAFWLTLMLGLAGSVGMALAAPGAAWFYGEPRLMGVIWVLAVQNMVSALTVLPDVRLTIDMRFRLISIVSFVTTVLTLIMTILMAWRGWGVYSFVVPPLLASVFRLGALWWAARPPVKWSWGMGEWRVLFGQSWLAIGTTFFLTVVSQADYVVLGRLHSDEKEVVGLYFWAFNLSVQTFQMVILNAGTVLFPALTKITADPQRQLGAFMRSGKLIALVAMPMMALQCVLCEPGIKLVFAAKWYPAIPLAQILSLGLLLQALGYPSINLMKAQGRFRGTLVMSIGLAVSFVAAVLVAAASFNGVLAATAVSAAAALFYALAGPLMLHISIKTIGGKWKDVWSMMGPAAIMSLAAMGVTWAADLGIAHLIGPGRVGLMSRLTLDCVLFIASYGYSIRLIVPSSFDEILSRVRRRRNEPSSTEAAFGR